MQPDKETGSAEEQPASNMAVPALETEVLLSRPTHGRGLILIHQAVEGQELAGADSGRHLRLARDMILATNKIT